MLLQPGATHLSEKQTLPFIFKATLTKVMKLTLFRGSISGQISDLQVQVKNAVRLS